MGTDKNRTMQSPKGHTSKEKFDLIVIGSGSGRDVANAAAQFGLKVAIVEKGRMGGTCLNRGCIPSKMLLHSADVAEVIKNAGKFGVNVDKYTVDFKKIVRRVNRIVDSDSTEIKKALSGVENPRLFPVQCRFIGPKTIAAGDDGAVITAKKILIASGARPAIPKIRGLNGSGYITSDEALRLDKQPRVLTIIGGGYIAAELAHFFGALGTKVNIIQSRNVLIPDEDEEVSRKFTDIFARKYNVYLGYTIKFVEKRGTRRHGVFVVTIRDAEGKVVKLKSDQLLVATGRIPNSDTLDLRRTGVEVNDAGFIKTDGYLETNVKGIFALGDAIGNYMLKHSANYEAQYAFNNIIKGVHHHKVDYTAMPHAIFSSPQVAAIVKIPGGSSPPPPPPSNISAYTQPQVPTAMGLWLRPGPPLTSRVSGGGELTPSSSMVGSPIKRVAVVVKKSGNATGTIFVRIRNSADAIAKEIGTISASALTAADQRFELTASTSYTLQANDKVLVEWSGTGSIADAVNVKRSAVDTFNAANTYFVARKTNGTYTNSTTRDMAGDWYKQV